MKCIEKVQLLIGAWTLAALFSLGCADNDPSTALEVKASAVSDCGGFAASSAALTDEDAPADYCAAEVLEWSYDKDAEILSLLNTRVILNCCGDHYFTTERAEDGTFVVTETDSPQKTSMGTYDRCDCECVFDYEIELADIPSEEISLRLMRHVTDSGAAETVWGGTLDLTASSIENSIVTNEEDADPWCGFAE